MTTTIQTSTTAIGYFAYSGMYETYIGEYTGCVAYDKREDAYKAIGEYYLENILGDALIDIFHRHHVEDDDFALAYVSTYCPQFYNFETDAIVFDFEFSDDIRDWFYGYVHGNKHFIKFLHDNYTSCSGFHSFTPNNWSDWKDGWGNNDWRCISALIRFVLEQEISDVDEYRYTFDDNVATIIEENYVSSAYAVRFDNGMTAVVIGEYNEEDDDVVYTARLLDTDDNVINMATVTDKYDEEFHMSAFAAWEYSWLEYDLTDKHKLCGTYYVPCDIPKLDC